MAADLNSLWVQYKDENLEAARDELIIHYSNLVKYVASRLAINLSTVVEFEELVSYGIEGLIDAIEKFDYKRNIKFETYATTRIRGAMIDGLRSMDFVPVSIRQKSKEIEKIYASLEAKLGRTATDQEVAELIQTLRNVAATTIISLDDFLPSHDQANRKKRIVDLLEDDKNPDILEVLELSDTKNILAQSISRLPEKEKLVVYFYYYEGLTLREIGAILSLSESRISQLHTKAILRLRGSLSKKKDQVM